jgi:hypothetical protein
MDEQTREAMRNNAIPNIHGETPYATVELTPREIRPRDRVFLQQWAEKLGVSIDVFFEGHSASSNRRPALRRENS